MTVRLQAAIALLILLLVGWIAYSPGLSGGFLFDDFVNLDKLASPGPTDNWPTFWRYITSGIADPIGRPLSLLTFLLDAHDWPADPAPFLRTNVLLHLLNGALLFLLLRRLSRVLGDGEARSDVAALVGAGLWLLHPLFVSTTLYIVQREAMLPATFTLLGLLAYVRGRLCLGASPRAGLAWMTLGIGVGTGLALLSKANGILLPLLAWVLEAVVLAPRLSAPLPRAFARPILVLPSAVIMGFLLWQLRLLHDPLAHRPWTIAQRLLTEPRVLVDYLQLLVVPRVISTGVYNDAYAASRSLMDPPATLFALLAIASLVAFAASIRKRSPALAAALLFFFAGHLLESSSIALELYFEHRNYLPALLLGWPVARAIAHWRVAVALRAAVCIGLLALFANTTWQRAFVWGTADRMALLWALQSPESSRAQATAAIVEINAGRAENAVARLAPLWRAKPYDLQLALNYASARCGQGGLSSGEVARIANAIAHSPEGNQLVYRWLSQAVDIAATGTCPGLGAATLQEWVHAAMRNPRHNLPGLRQNLHSIAGRVALLDGNGPEALREFNAALDSQYSDDAAGLQVALLAASGHYRRALDHLTYAETLRVQHEKRIPFGMQRLHAWVLERQAYWPTEFAILRRKLDAEIRTQDQATNTRASR